MGAPAGLRLPPGLLQPFDLKALHDDLHVIAFFDGHPVYEAVEAMVRERPGQAPWVRAILTRHDQSQVDHVTELPPPDALATGRHTVQRPIGCTLGQGDRGPWARIAFDSHDGEAVVLEVHAAGQPTTDRAGVSDPGDHALHGSLPLMWRGRSAIASPLTQVTLGGQRHEVPVLVDRRPHFVGLHGFFTQQHRMAIVRAGVVEQRRFGAPEGQVIAGAFVDGGFVLAEVGVASAGHSDGMRLSFGDGGFRCAIDGTDAAIEGRATCELADGAASIRLVPASPAWAVRREVHVACTPIDGGWRIETTVGR